MSSYINCESHEPIYWAIVYRDIERCRHGLVFRLDTRVNAEAEKFAELVIPENYTSYRIVNKGTDCNSLVCNLASEGYDVKLIKEKTV